MVCRERGRDVFGGWGVVFWSWSVVGGSRGVVGGGWGMVRRGRSMVLGSRGMVLGCRGVVFGGSGVVSLSIIGDISHKTVVAIGVVADMLDTSIRQVDGVGSFHIACSVAALTSAEHSLGVVVSHGVAVGVGKDLVRIVGWLSVVGRFHWSVVCRGSVVSWCWGVVGGGRWGGVGVSVVSWCRGGVGRCRSGVCGCWSGIGRCWSMVGRGRGWCRGVIG